ncbi:MAG: bifunctional enoyl-CoA hydratase/phosphate acetyltransferase [Marinobacterium sp.]|nr:bifunctional enoyl-CoA hydratase/phosphate acetyltransferase [Marinobacterium sp.]
MTEHAAQPTHKHLENFIDEAAQAGTIRAAVVNPIDHNSLLGAHEAAVRGLIEPVLIGPEHLIRQAAEEEEIDVSGYEILHTAHRHMAPRAACGLIREGGAATLMKGSQSTAELLAAVVDKHNGLRTERRLSHVFVLDVPTYHKPLVVTDAAINVAPELMVKADIAQNAINFCHALGIDQPKLAILSAVEKVKPGIPSTIEAAALCKMADRNQITGAILDGPLAFDNAISLEAANDKHIDSPIAGDVDILMPPNLEAANMIAKQLIYLADAKAAGIALGASVPIILTSRAEKPLGRLASCALASYIVRHQEK